MALDGRVNEKLRHRFDRYTAATRALHRDRHLEQGSSVAPPIHQSVRHFADDAEDFAHRASEPLHDSF